MDRKPPNGVGRALRDGYMAATGRYILTMGSDFVQILPEFRDLFDGIARGNEGAIGSRFAYYTIMVNYPFPKIIANRSFHLLANLLLPIRCRDLSNMLLAAGSIRADGFVFAGRFQRRRFSCEIGRAHV